MLEPSTRIYVVLPDIFEPVMTSVPAERSASFGVPASSVSTSGIAPFATRRGDASSRNVGKACSSRVCPIIASESKTSISAHTSSHPGAAAPARVRHRAKYARQWKSHKNSAFARTKKTKFRRIATQSASRVRLLCARVARMGVESGASVSRRASPRSGARSSARKIFP